MGAEMTCPVCGGTGYTDAVIDDRCGRCGTTGVVAGRIMTERQRECWPHLPSESTARKAIPIATAFTDFFPDAIVELARTAAIGSQQHNTGEPTRWDRSKSGDEWDALMRHFMDRGTVDKDGLRHSAKVAWRAMAALQKEMEDLRDSLEAEERGG